jgi:hypothetical protein
MRDARVADLEQQARLPVVIGSYSPVSGFSASRQSQAWIISSIITPSSM